MENECQEHVFEEVIETTSHFYVIKWIGILLMLIICTCTFGIIISTAGRGSLPLDYEVKVDFVNHTTCVYLEKYTYLENEYTICIVDGVFHIDVFLEGKEFTFQLSHWNILKRLSPLIDASLYKANTYWKSL
jgi:hypothetical protein